MVVRRSRDVRQRDAGRDAGRTCGVVGLSPRQEIAVRVEVIVAADRDPDGGMVQLELRKIRSGDADDDGRAAVDPHLLADAAGSLSGVLPERMTDHDTRRAVGTGVDRLAEHTPERRSVA